MKENGDRQMALNGYIKLYRRFLEWEWYHDINTRVVMLDLLLRATHRERDWKGIHLRPGQVPTSYAGIAKNCNISVRSARTSIKHLISTGELTVESTNQLTIVTIENWSLYQVEDGEPTSEVTNKVTIDRQATDKRPTSDRQQLKNEKNVKNEKNIYKGFRPPDLEEVKAYCQERKNKVDPEAFMDHYQSNGWMVGKSKMKDWKAAVRNWERTEAGLSRQSTSKSSEPPRYREFEPAEDKAGVPMSAEQRKRQAEITRRIAEVF